MLSCLLCRLQEVLAVLEARAKIDAERATRNNMAAVNVRNKVRVLAESLSALDVPPPCQQMRIWKARRDHADITSPWHCGYRVPTSRTPSKMCQRCRRAACQALTAATPLPAAKRCPATTGRLGRRMQVFACQ